MCSAEYLSPELIFNLGHNQSSDLWALGVIIYEMLMAVTPFAPKRPDNVTELFTNIAMVKVRLLYFSLLVFSCLLSEEKRSCVVITYRSTRWKSSSKTIDQSDFEG
jgi:serine/threonine protein kinase